MVWNPNGWGYGGIGYTMAPVDNYAPAPTKQTPLQKFLKQSGGNERQRTKMAPQTEADRMLGAYGGQSGAALGRAGTAVSMLTGVPGLGLAGAAYGSKQDVDAVNEHMKSLGMEERVSPMQAVLRAASPDITPLGASPEEQIDRTIAQRLNTGYYNPAAEEQAREWANLMGGGVRDEGGPIFQTAEDLRNDGRDRGDDPIGGGRDYTGPDDPGDFGGWGYA